MAVPAGLMGLGVQGPSETGFEGQGLTEAGSGDLDSRRWDLEGQRLNAAGFGMQGPDRAGFGRLRHPTRQIWGQTPHEADGELPIPSQRTEFWALWGGFGRSSPPGPGDSGVCRGGAQTQERHRNTLS